MSTQYDNIGIKYEQLRKLPGTVLEKGNVKAAITPFIKSAKVLDLACGYGFYAKTFLEWGAASVLGVDISKAMVDAAQQIMVGEPRISFEVADCALPVRYGGGPFDIVFASWLLNYASTKEEMTEMFRNIALNVKDGGHFVGVVPYPTDNPKEQVEKMMVTMPKQYDGVTTHIREVVEGGVATQIAMEKPTGKIEFDTYYLSRTVYERSARAGGLDGTLTWKPVFVLEEREDRLNDENDTAWNDYLTLPHFTVLVITKDDKQQTNRLAMSSARQKARQDFLAHREEQEDSSETIFQI